MRVNDPDTGWAGLARPDGSTVTFGQIPPPTVSGVQKVPLLRCHLVLSVLDLVGTAPASKAQLRLVECVRDITNRVLKEPSASDIRLIEQSTVVLATGNKNKLIEHRAALLDKAYGPSPNVVDQSTLGLADVDETCDTLVGNAALKAYAAAKATGLPAVSDDTGLFIDSLGGQPGVFTARYAGAHSDYDAIKSKIHDNLKAFKHPERKATFRTVAALADPSGPLGDYVLWVQGETHGDIVEQEQAPPPNLGGWGLDPVFAPYDFERNSNGRLKTFADVSLEQRLRISHRGRAFASMRQCLVLYLVAKAKIQLE